MYQRVLQEPLEFPANGTLDSPSARDLIARLLERDPEKRLKDAAEVRRHPFFEGTDWDALVHLQVNAPYIPEIVSPEDVSVNARGCASECQRMCQM